MQQAVEKVFFALIRFEINGDELCDEIKNLITPDILPALFKLSKRHDLAHLVGDALDKMVYCPMERKRKSVFCKSVIWRYIAMSKFNMSMNKFVRY